MTREGTAAGGGPAHPASFYEYAQLLDRAAVIEADGLVVDYATLGRRVNQVSHALRAAGVRPGDKIAGLLANTSRFLELELGAAQAGVHFVAVNTHLTGAEVAYIVGNSGSRLVFADAEFLPQATAALDATGGSSAGLIAIDGPPGYRSYAEFTGGHSPSPPEERVYAMRSMYTSGTTGRPKGVVWPIDARLDPERAVAAVDWIMAQRGMVHDPAAVTLISGPLFHGAPGSWATAALHRGHTVVLTAKWDSERFLHTVQRYRVTTAQLAPVHFFRLLQLPAAVRDRFDVSSLRVISHAGAPTPVETKRRMIDWMGPILYEYYGSSEGWGTTISSADWLAHPGSVGRHDGEGARMKILDENGAGLPPGEPGILWVRNPTGVNSEYLGDPDATAANRSGEYYTVGDIAYLDSDGWLFIVDRRTDLILSGAVNVYPAEVEDALRQHPAVSDVAVVGVSDPEWGQRVCAVIVPLPGHPAGPDLAAQVRAFARTRLAGHKAPKQVMFRESLPYSPAGKLLRREVRADLEALAAGRLDDWPLSPP
jgi:long-chain acyl-CoA synthetase